MMMGFISPFVLIAILIGLSYAMDKITDNHMSVFLLLISASLTMVLMLTGHAVRRNAVNSWKYNAGCWLQWCAVWALLLTLIGMLDLLVELNG